MVRGHSATNAWERRPRLFPQVTPVGVRQRVHPVDTRNRVLRFELVQAAGGQDEFIVALLPGQMKAPHVKISERQPKLPPCGSQAFSEGVSALWHNTTLSAFGGCGRS